MPKLKLFKVLFLLVGFLWVQPQAFSRVLSPAERAAYKRFFVRNLQEMFRLELHVESKIYGAPKKGKFERVEMDLAPFQYQGLAFTKGELDFEHLWMDPQSLSKWQLKLLNTGEVQSSLGFTISSFEQKLASLAGHSASVTPDVQNQEFVVKGKGRFLGLPMRAIPPM